VYFHVSLTNGTNEIDGQLMKLFGGESEMTLQFVYCLLEIKTIALYQGCFVVADTPTTA
jgi:hypothetical protein